MLGSTRLDRSRPLPSRLHSALRLGFRRGRRLAARHPPWPHTGRLRLGGARRRGGFWLLRWVGHLPHQTKLLHDRPDALDDILPSVAAACPLIDRLGIFRQELVPGHTRVPPLALAQQDDDDKEFLAGRFAQREAIFGLEAIARSQIIWA